MNKPGITSLDFSPFEEVTALSHNWKYSKGLNKSIVDLELLVVKVSMLSNVFIKVFTSKFTSKPEKHGKSQILKQIYDVIVHWNTVY